MPRQRSMAALPLYYYKEGVTITMGDYAWRVDGRDDLFVVGGQEFSIDKRGAEYARQFGRLTAWLGTYGISGLMSAYEDGAVDLDGGSDLSLSVGMLSYLMEYGLSPEAVIELGSIILGCDYKFAEEHFDPGWVVDGLITLIDMKPGIVSAFRRVWERFFLGAEPDPAGGEG